MPDTARKAYEAYSKTVHFKNHQGLPMLAWDDLPQTLQEAWSAAARAAVIENNVLTYDEREYAIIQFALVYASSFSGAGVPGHNLLLLIAKQARQLTGGATSPNGMG